MVARQPALLPLTLQMLFSSLSLPILLIVMVKLQVIYLPQQRVEQKFSLIRHMFGPMVKLVNSIPIFVLAHIQLLLPKAMAVLQQRLPQFLSQTP